MKSGIELQDIHVALEIGDTEFAAGLLKEYLFDNPLCAKGYHLLARYFIDIEMSAFAYPVAKAAAAADPSWRNLMILGASEAVLQMPAEAEKNLNRALNRMPKTEPEKHKAILYRVMSSAAVQAYKFDKAEHWAKKSLAIEEHHQAHSALGFAKLHQRQWKEGWWHYAFQLGHNKARDRHDYGLPEWNGEPDAKLLVYGDQGLGDQIAYMSSIPENQIAIVNTHPKLSRLFARSFPNAKVYGEQFKKPVSFDHTAATHQVSMATAQIWCEMKRRGKYLKPLREKTLQWNGLISSVNRSLPRVGIAWTGGNVGSDGWRSRDLTLDQLEPLLRLPACWVSLEYRDRTEELEAFGARTGIVIHDWHWATITQDYDDTAALVDSLDAVVTVPTTAYHLAGALAVPSCVLVHRTPHFHEGIEGDCPWWQTVDFVRRPHFKSDAEAIETAAQWVFKTINENRRAM